MNRRNPETAREGVARALWCAAYSWRAWKGAEAEERAAWLGQADLAIAEAKALRGSREVRGRDAGRVEAADVQRLRALAGLHGRKTIAAELEMPVWKVAEVAKLHGISLKLVVGPALDVKKAKISDAGLRRWRQPEAEIKRRELAAHFRRLWADHPDLMLAATARGRAAGMATRVERSRLRKAGLPSRAEVAQGRARDRARAWAEAYAAAESRLRRLGADPLYAAVSRAVAHIGKTQEREDTASELALRVLAGEITLEDLPSAMRSARGVARGLLDTGRFRSLDVPDLYGRTGVEKLADGGEGAWS